MNIHKSQLFWCELQGYTVLTHCHFWDVRVDIRTPGPQRAMQVGWADEGGWPAIAWSSGFCRRTTHLRLIYIIHSVSLPFLYIYIHQYTYVYMYIIIYAYKTRKHHINICLDLTGSYYTYFTWICPKQDMYPTFRGGHPEDATADERRGIVVTGQGKGRPTKLRGVDEHSWGLPSGKLT